MTKEIKFRYWCKEIDKMIFTYEPDEQGKREYYPLVVDIGFSHWDKNWLSEPMQYTQLRDKNGKEIYEGDILEDDFGQRVKCVWFDHENMDMPAMTGFTFVGIGKQNGWSAVHMSWLLMAEVIGNIYENPELLVKR